LEMTINPLCHSEPLGEESIKSFSKQILRAIFTSLAINVSAGCRYQRRCLFIAKPRTLLARSSE
ncbi:MAG: hypothetical protein Q4E87_10430, partial [bacterium]|nr:hypothetical protein [bacterium]